jgi:hypothetical protein
LHSKADNNYSPLVRRTMKPWRMPGPPDVQSDVSPRQASAVTSAQPSTQEHKQALSPVANAVRNASSIMSLLNEETSDLHSTPAKIPRPFNFVPRGRSPTYSPPPPLQEGATVDPWDNHTADTCDGTILNNDFLPSPSSFWPDWNFRGSDSNTDTIPNPSKSGVPGEELVYRG